MSGQDQGEFSEGFDRRANQIGKQEMCHGCLNCTKMHVRVQNDVNIGTPGSSTSTSTSIDNSDGETIHALGFVLYYVIVWAAPFCA